MTKLKGEGVVTTETTSGESDLEEMSVESPFDGPADPPLPFAEVAFGCGFTKKTADYENVKVYVFVKLPVELEHLDEGYEFAVGWVEDRVNAKMTEIKQMLGEE